MSSHYTPGTYDRHAALRIVLPPADALNVPRPSGGLGEQAGALVSFLYSRKLTEYLARSRCLLNCRCLLN